MDSMGSAPSSSGGKSTSSTSSSSSSSKSNLKNKTKNTSKSNSKDAASNNATTSNKNGNSNNAATSNNNSSSNNGEKTRQDKREERREEEREEQERKRRERRKHERKSMAAGLQGNNGKQVMEMAKAAGKEDEVKIAAKALAGDEVGAVKDAVKHVANERKEHAKSVVKAVKGGPEEVIKLMLKDTWKAIKRAIQYSMVTGCSLLPEFIIMLIIVFAAFFMIISSGTDNSGSGSGIYDSTSGVIGDDNESKVWFTLRQTYGLSEIDTASVMGNIANEGGLVDTGRIEDGKTFEEGGIGMCGWTFYTRKDGLINYANSKGVNWSDIDTQIEYLGAEITGQGPAAGYAPFRMVDYDGYTVAQWKKETDVSKATSEFCWMFERPDESVAHEDRRISSGIEIYNKYKGKTYEQVYSGNVRQGEFPASDYSKEVFGTYKNFKGKIFYIYDQAYVRDDFRDSCNRYAAMTIASAYSSNKNIKSMKAKCPNANGNWMLCPSDQYFQQYGLSARRIDNSSFKSEIRKALLSGGYAMIYYKSGYHFSPNYLHWVSVIDYNNSTDEIGVADNANGTSGWYNLKSDTISNGIYTVWIITPNK